MSDTLEIDTPEAAPPPLPAAAEFSITDLDEPKPEAEAKETDSPKMTPQEAWERSHSHTFKGSSEEPRLLEPFSPDRQIAAQAMGMEFLNMSDEAREEFQAKGTYNGIFRDAVFAVWLCTQSLPNVAKWAGTAATARGVAMQWANKNNVTLGSAAHAELIDLFGAFIDEIMASTTVPDESGGGSAPAEPGESTSAGGQNTAS